MNISRSIQLKAALLLTVFGLNTVVGFACALGVNLGFNRPQHGNDAGTGSVHIHKDGKKHIHKTGTAKHGHTKKATNSKKDDCCKDKVVKLQNADKSVQYSKTTIDVPVYIIPGKHARIDILKTVDSFLTEYVACHFHPPPRDIRIAIQSFQI